MDVKKRWLASTDPEEEKGLAEFDIDGFHYRFGLRSFDDFQQVEAMVKTAFERGKSDAETAMRKAIREL